jgi:hypothetical protein
MKKIETYKDFVNEVAMATEKSDKLAKLISNSINQIDDSLSYRDFAMAISSIMKEDYGRHNYKSFLDVLKKELK